MPVARTSRLCRRDQPGTSSAAPAAASADCAAVGIGRAVGEIFRATLRVVGNPVHRGGGIRPENL
jgi:hypothetical protein